MASLHSMKVVFVGESNVGKTSICQRFINKGFSHNQPSTVGAAFFDVKVKANDLNFKLQIWDTAGQERFHAMAPIYYRGAKGGLIVYSIDERDSFDKCKKWVSELRQADKDIVLLLLGNKCDLRALPNIDKSNFVSTELAQNYAESENLTFLEVSALSDHNIETAMKALVTGSVEKTPTIGNLDVIDGFSLDDDDDDEEEDDEEFGDDTLGGRPVLPSEGGENLSKELFGVTGGRRSIPRVMCGSETLPLTETSITVEIVDSVAEVLLCLSFENTGKMVYSLGGSGSRILAVEEEEDGEKETSPEGTVEAFFYFPIDELQADDITVSGFEALSDGQVIISSIKERETVAKLVKNSPNCHQHVFSAGKGIEDVCQGYLQEGTMMNEEGSYLQGSLGKIEPEREVKFVIRLSMDLKVENGCPFFTFPPPSLLASPFFSVDASRIHLHEDYRFGMSFHFVMVDIIRHIDFFSPTLFRLNHLQPQGSTPALTSSGSNSSLALASSSSSTSLNNSLSLSSSLISTVAFNLAVMGKEASAGLTSSKLFKEQIDIFVYLEQKTDTSFPPNWARVWLESDDDHDNAAVMVSLTPQVTFSDFEAATNAEYVLCVERTTNALKSWDEIKRAMQVFIRSLPENAYFNVIGFGGGKLVKVFQQKSVQLTTKSLAQTLTEINDWTPDLKGDSEVGIALRTLLRGAQPQMKSKFIVLTAGTQFSNDAVEYLRNAYTPSVEVYLVGIGSHTQHLVEMLCKTLNGRGEVAFEKAEIVSALVRHLKRALGFELTDVRMEWMKNQREVTTAPLMPPPLFKSQCSRFFGLIANYGSLRAEICLPLNVRSGDSIVGCDLKLVAETIRPAGKLLHYRFGASIVKDLEMRMKREIARATTPQLQRQIEEAYSSEITKFSKICSIPSIHTAWIAEEKKQQQKESNGDDAAPESLIRLWQSNFTPSVSNIIAPPPTPIGTRRKPKVLQKPKEKVAIPVVAPKKAEFARHWIVSKPGGLMLHALQEKEKDDEDLIRPEDIERSAAGTPQQKKCCGGEANNADLSSLSTSTENSSFGSKVRRWFSRNNSDIVNASSSSSPSASSSSTNASGDESLPVAPSSSSSSLLVTTTTNGVPRNIDLSVLYDIIGIQQPDGGFKSGEVQSLASKVSILSQVLGTQLSKPPSFVERNLKDLWATASIVALIETINDSNRTLGNEERWELNLLKAKLWMATTLTKTPPKAPPNVLVTGEFYPFHHYPHWILFAKHSFLCTR